MSFFIYLSLLISFFTFLFPILVGNLLGSKGVAIIVIGNYFMLYSISIVLLLLLFILGDHSNIIICDWVSLHLLNIQYSFFIDSFSVIMFFLITFISLLVQIYSYEYLLYDPHLPRYYAYLGLFTFFMIFLIFSIDFLQFFLAWEGVGICSYLLINFWYLRFKASKSAILAVLVNKIVDIFLFSINYLSTPPINSIFFLKNPKLVFYIIKSTYIESLLHISTLSFLKNDLTTLFKMYHVFFLSEIQIILFITFWRKLLI